MNHTSYPSVMVSSAPCIHLPTQAQVKWAIKSIFQIHATCSNTNIQKKVYMLKQSILTDDKRYNKVIGQAESFN